MMFIFFEHETSDAKIKELVLKLTQNKKFIIHGNYIKNCYISENANDPGHFVITCNDIPDTNAFANILRMPEVDPVGCKYNDMRECANILGVCETNARHYEELVYTFRNICIP